MSSHAWATKDKLLGTLVLPFGPLPAFVVAAILGMGSGRTCSSSQVRPGGPVIETCTGGATALEAALWLALLAALVIAPIAVAIRLGRRLQTRGHASASH